MRIPIPGNTAFILKRTQDSTHSLRNSASVPCDGDAVVVLLYAMGEALFESGAVDDIVELISVEKKDG